MSFPGEFGEEIFSNNGEEIVKENFKKRGGKKKIFEERKKFEIDDETEGRVSQNFERKERRNAKGLQQFDNGNYRTADI